MTRDTPETSAPQLRPIPELVDNSQGDQRTREKDRAKTVTYVRKHTGKVPKGKARTLQVSKGKP